MRWVLLLCNDIHLTFNWDLFYSPPWYTQESPYMTMNRLGQGTWHQLCSFSSCLSCLSPKLLHSYSLSATTVEAKKKLKSLLMKVKEKSKTVGLILNIQKTKIMASGPITSWQIDGEQWKQCQTLFWGAPKSLQMVIVAMKLKDAYSLEGKLRPT